MYVTQQHLNSVWKNLIDKLKDDEVVVNTYCGGLGRLMSKVDPLITIHRQLCIDEEGNEYKTLTGLPADADYRGPDGCMINIKRKVFNGKEWCTTKTIDAGTLNENYIAYIDRVGSWEFVGTDRWKKEVIIDVTQSMLVEDELEPVYEEDNEHTTDLLETTQSSFTVRFKASEKTKKDEEDICTFYDAIDTVLSGKDNIVRRRVLIPTKYLPDTFSDVYVLRDEMKVLVTKHINIATGERLKYKKVINSSAFSQVEVDKIQHVTKW